MAISTPAPTRWARLSRVSLAAAFAGTAVAAVVFNTAVRAAEVQITGLAVRPITDGLTTVAPKFAALWWGLGTDRPFGIRVAPECSAAFIIAPLLLVAAAFALLGGRHSARRLVSVAAVTVALVVAVNSLRLVVIAWSTWQWGDSGFRWTHTVGGSLLSTVGFGLAMVGFIWMLSGKGAARPATALSRV